MTGGGLHEFVSQRRTLIEKGLLVLVGVGVGLAIGFLSSSSTASIGGSVLVGVLVAVGTYLTIQVTRQGQITERISTAVEQLAASKNGGPDEVRVLGGIYALERVAKESSADYGTVMEIVTAYVRKRVSKELPEGDRRTSRDELPNDAQAALAVLARRSRPPSGTPKLDLRDTDLRRAKLPDAHFEGALLREADLCEADMRKAHLNEADLRGADLTGAHLSGATGAELSSSKGKPHCGPIEECDLPD
jgi:hypothetical protein